MLLQSMYEFLEMVPLFCVLGIQNFTLVYDSHNIYYGKKEHPFLV